IQTPLANLSDCGKEITRWIEADKKLKQNGVRLGLRHGKNQWAVFGSVLEDKEDVTIRNIHLGAGRRLLYARGDKAAKDVDLFLPDNDGVAVAEDATGNADALIDFTAANNERYSLKMRNFQGGRAIVVSTIFEVR